MSKTVLKVKCDAPEIMEAFTQIVMMSKIQLQEHISALLARKGIPSDTKIKIQDDEIIISQKTGERGMVIVSQGIGMETSGYDVLPDNTKYMVVEQGAVRMYLKRPDNIDIELGRYEDLETAIAAVNSNDIVDAVRNILEPKQPVLLDESNSNNEQNGDPEATV